jgi:hypothetical protein
MRLVAQAKPASLQLLPEHIIIALLPGSEFSLWSFPLQILSPRYIPHKEIP